MEAKLCIACLFEEHGGFCSQCDCGKEYRHY